MAEKIWEWAPDLQSGDVFSPTIADSWDNLVFTSTEETLKHLMHDLRTYHLAGLQASTLTPRPTETQYNMLESIFSDDSLYNALKNKASSAYGYDIDDYIVTYAKIAIGYTTQGYSGTGVDYDIWLVPKDKIALFTFPALLSTSSETISGYYSTHPKTVYYFRMPNNSASITEIIHAAGSITLFSDGMNWSSISLARDYKYFYINQGSTKTQGGAAFGVGRWSYVSAFYGSAINNESRDLYNPDGSDTATSGKYPSSELGGLGTFDDRSDLSDISTKPSLNISDLGFFSIWNPTPSQLRSLADFVWNDPANWQQWGQIFQSGILKPLDYIISLSVLPIPSSALTLATHTFCMGGIIFDGRVTALGINLSMNQVQEQFVDINLGTLSLKEYFGSFLDYAPYSQISIYLPFYGVAELSMNELQNADAIQLVYRINILDGSCAIKLLIDRQTASAQNGSIPLKHVLYEYYTNVKTDVPLTQGANTEHLKMAATMITAAVAMAAPIAGAGAAALAGGAGAAVGGSATMADILGSASASAAANGGKIAAGIQAGAQGAQKMVNAMPSGGGMQRGNISGMSSGLLSERRPFLIVTRPIQVLPEQYKEEMGYTASIKASISDIGTGFVKFDSIDLSSLDCEESERGQILDLLTNVGVYI